MRSAWKRARRRVAAVRLAPAQHARDEIGEGSRRLAAAIRRATLDDGAGDGARAPLLAQLVEDVGQRLLVERVDHVGGGRAVARHAHVERAVGLEGEAALRLVELHRGDADVEHHAVDGREPCASAIASSAPNRPSAIVRRPGNSATSSAPASMAVGSRSMASTRQSAAAENGARIAACAERSVDDRSRRCAGRGSPELQRAARGCGARTAQWV